MVIAKCQDARQIGQKLFNEDLIQPPAQEMKSFLGFQHGGRAIYINLVYLFEKQALFAFG
ncbi:hypothetical protein [Nitrosospira sp. Nl5]|uniref:hypothetical protein n=1 Tax=Nitrosospira sp. Nl5 TaxID=200120 RepID=UPI000B86FE3F|nr:hypothetical protein [Nitrosospira sp. Nl5]